MDDVTLRQMMKETDLTLQEITGQASPPKLAVIDKWQTYKYGRSLISPDWFQSMPTQMYKLNKWYMDACQQGLEFISVKIRDEDYFRGEDLICIKYSELHQLLYKGALDKSLLSCWCL